MRVDQPLAASVAIELCEQNEITIDWRRLKDDHAYGSLDSGTTEIPLIQRLVSYGTGLHEMATYLGDSAGGNLARCHVPRSATFQKTRLRADYLSQRGSISRKDEMKYFSLPRIVLRFISSTS